MGVTRIKQQDHNNTYYTEFVIDEIKDIASLPTSFNQVAPGSVAICIEDSEVYMLSTKGEWRIL